MKERKSTAIIVDDHEMFRAGIKSIIEKDGLAEVVAEASNGRELLEILKNYIPDIILMDVDMPLMGGAEACEKALSMHPGLKILILSMYDDYTHYSSLISIGVKGFVSKFSGKTDLERGIEAVCHGDSYFSSDLLRNIIVEIDKSKTRPAADDDEVVFTSRELEVLKLICNGLSTNEIAEILFLSNKTIDNHRSRLLQKTGVKNSVGLVLYAIRNKIVTF
jgi:DNA-binding NarL/FixJ family response regulator